MKQLAIILFLLSSVATQAQYAPPAGQEGSTAIYADSSLFVEWASECHLQRGWVNIADTSLGKTSYGSNLSALGKADNDVVSLGDGGMATVKFNKPVTNGTGYDFAVFENAFDDNFLELAFVEVSSDSINFFRFPAVSNTQTDAQVETFGTLDATQIHNLAGKYRLFYGVPFDLDELKEVPGLDVNNIVAVRLIDVVGSINDAFCSFDSEGNKINDPWPTPFESGGFDLDAVGVIHNKVTSVQTNLLQTVNIYPNPCSDKLFISGKSVRISIFDISGKLLLEVNDANISFLDVSNLPKGILLVDMEKANHRHQIFKLIKN